MVIMPIIMIVVTTGLPVAALWLLHLGIRIIN